MKFCFNCGEAIEDNAIVCPKCQTKLQETSNEPIAVIYNETQKDVSAKRNLIKDNKYIKQVSAKVMSLIQKYQKYCLIGFCLFAVLFFILGITTITSGDYKDYSESYTEYMDNYKENSRKSASYGGTGLLGSGYNIVAEGWKDLADGVASKLWGLRVKALLFVVIGGGFSFCAVKTYKLKKEQAIE